MADFPLRMIAAPFARMNSLQETQPIEPPTETNNCKTNSAQEETELNAHKSKVCKSNFT